MEKYGNKQTRNCKRSVLKKAKLTLEAYKKFALCSKIRAIKFEKITAFVMTQNPGKENYQSFNNLFLFETILSCLIITHSYLIIIHCDENSRVIFRLKYRENGIRNNIFDSLYYILNDNTIFGILNKTLIFKFPNN